MIWKQGAGARRLCRAAALVGIVASLGGCSSVPDAVNPVSWYHGVVGSDDEKPAAKPNALSGDKSVPNADKPYPSIGSVPDKPPPPSTQAERAAAAKSLVADNTAAHYADMEIRRQTDESGTPPPSPPPSKPSAPAPSAGPAHSAAATTNTPPPSTSNAPSAPAETTKNVAPTPVVPPAHSRAASAPARLAPAPGNSPARRNVAAGPVPQVPATPPPAPRIPTAPPASAPAASGSGAAAPSVGSDAPEQQVAQRRAATPEAPLVFGPPPPDIAIAETMRTPQTRQPNARSTRRPAHAPRQQRMTQNADGAPAPASTYGPYFPSGVPFVRQPTQGYTLPGYRGERVASIYFRNGSARLGSRDVATIREAVRAWRARGGVMVVVGHASPDSRGGNSVRHEMSNFSISLDRANAVAREIMRLGVDPSAVRVKAVSDAQPAYYPSGAASGAESRRADILIEQ